MTQSGLTTVSEAQHRELVTGGDAFGTEGVVEDVTEYVDFGTDHAAPEDAVESAQDSETTADGGAQGETTTDSTTPDGLGKRELLIGAGLIGAVALSRRQT